MATRPSCLNHDKTRYMALCLKRALWCPWLHGLAVWTMMNPPWLDWKMGRHLKRAINKTVFPSLIQTWLTLYLNRHTLLLPTLDSNLLATNKDRISNKLISDWSLFDEMLCSPSEACFRRSLASSTFSSGGRMSKLVLLVAMWPNKIFIVWEIFLREAEINSSFLHLLWRIEHLPTLTRATNSFHHMTWFEQYNVHLLEIACQVVEKRSGGSVEIRATANAVEKGESVFWPQGGFYWRKKCG